MPIDDETMAAAVDAARGAFWSHQSTSPVAVMQEAVSAALAALEARGYKVLAREATEEMVTEWPDDPDTLPNRDDIREAWRAMWNAAPGSKP